MTKISGHIRKTHKTVSIGEVLRRVIPTINDPVAQAKRWQQRKYEILRREAQITKSECRKQIKDKRATHVLRISCSQWLIEQSRKRLS